MNTKELHVVLGATGAAGSHVVAELARRGHPVRAVSRHRPDDLPEGVEWRGADVTDPGSVAEATRGAGTVYMAAQPAYTRWAAEFPPMLDAVLQGVAGRGARLVMVDNLYMYGPVTGPLTEDSPQEPTSRKGRVRKAMAETLLAAHRRGDVRVVIARGSDFYGPGVHGSAVGSPFFRAVLSGKRPQWVGRADVPHSFTFVPDYARALVLLGERPDASWEVWHIPAAEPLTAGALARLIAGEAGAPPREPAAVRGAALRLAGLFVPVVREMADIDYQYVAPFVTDGARFAAAFDFAPTPHEQAVRQTLSWLTAHPAPSRG